MNTGYTIRYSVKGGGSGIMTRDTLHKVRDELISLHKQRMTARVERNSDNQIIGEVVNTDGKWNWYLDMEA